MIAHIADGGPLLPRDDDPKTVPEMLQSAALRQPLAGVGVEGCGATARFTPYPQLLERAGRVLGGLHAAGVKRGDAAVLQISRIDDLLTALWACLLGGIRPVAATPPPYDPADPALDRLCGAWRLLEHPVLIGDDDAVAGVRLLPRDHPMHDARTLSFASCARSAAPPELPSVAPDDVALYLLSSGSTGRAKVIPLTHRGLVELGIAGREQMCVAPGDVSFSWMPIDHSGGLLVYHLVPVFAGASAWYAPTEWVLADPLRWLDVVDRLRANHTWAPTFGFRLVADALAATNAREARGFDLRCLKGLLCAGEQILESAMSDFLRAAEPFGVAPGMILPAWGMTETCSGVAFGWYDEPDAIQQVDGRRFVSVGRPSPGAKMRVVDQEGRTLPQARVGRLQLRSARVTPGYVGGGEADAAAFGDDGWFDTGDLAQLRGNRLTIVGRAKDLIVLNGGNYSCHEIEEAAGSAPGVRADRVAAVGVPDEARGSELLAVVFVPDASETSDDPTPAIQAALAERLGLTAAITTAVDDADFPRTDSGKVQRAQLRERLR
ncbi:MAG: AMP-binding protein, partial [Stackebrandtia sp.]